MIGFAGFMMWAFNASEYFVPGERATSIWRPLWDSIYYSKIHSNLSEHSPRPLTLLTCVSQRTLRSKYGSHSASFGPSRGTNPTRMVHDLLSAPMENVWTSAKPSASKGARQILTQLRTRACASNPTVNQHQHDLAMIAARDRPSIPLQLADCRRKVRVIMMPRCVLRNASE
jgi:hypothetical protein